LSAIVFFAAATALGVAFAACRRRAAPGATALALLMLAVAEWTWFRGLEGMADLFTDKVFWAKFEYFGIVSVAPLWLLFALGYARQTVLPTRSHALLWAVPGITLALVFTSDHHRLIWTSIVRSPREPSLLLYSHGAWFWVLLAYSYVLLGVGTVTLMLAIARFPSAFRNQAAALLLAVSLPWCGNLVYVTGLSPVPGLDLTPLAMTLSGVIAAWAIFHRHLLDLVPVAREVLVENLADGVVVLDARDRIVDCNPAAGRLLHLSVSSGVGAAVADVLTAWPEIIAALDRPTATIRETQAPGAAAQHLEFRVSLLYDLRQRVTGRLISLRDVTDRRRAEDALRQSEAHFRALFEQAPEAYYLTDIQGRFLEVNGAAETLTGCRRADLMGKSILAIDLLAVEDRPRAETLHARSTAGEPTGPDELTLLKPDGMRIHVEISTSPFRLGDQVLVLGIARDVTARRQAERALRESEERYRNLVENIEELICTHDLSGRVLTVNRSLIQNMGYERPEDFVGRSLAEFLAPPVCDRFREYLTAIARDGRASGIMKVVTRQGEERELEFSTILGRDSHGGLVAWGVSRDVTERRRAEQEIRILNEQLEQRVQQRTQELRVSQQRFEALARIAPVGIYRTDRWGQITYVNDTWCRIHGVSPEEGMGVGYFDLLHPDDRQRFLTPWPRNEADPQLFDFEGRLKRRDGSIVWIMVRMVPQYSEAGQPVGSVGTVTDITALRLAEEEQRKLASLVENSPDLVAVSEVDGHLVYLNTAGRRLVGLGDLDDVRSRTLLDLVPPDGRAFAESTIISAVLEQGSWEGEMQLRQFGRDEAVDVAGRGFLIREPASAEPRFLALVARDVVERKRAEAALRDRDEQLRQSQKMEAVGRLAGGIAHDFNNLLTVILGRSELALSSLAPNDPGRRDLEAIKTTAERAAALTWQLLAFSRGQVLQPRVVDLHVVVGNVVPMLRRLIGEDIEIHTVAGAALGGVKVDPGQIEQVIVNLAVNARDAMLHGGRLVIATANAVLGEDSAGTLGSILPGSYVILSVSDTGIGMDEETRLRVFEPFFTTKPQGKGTGLGLSMVYGIVQQHAGAITVESAPGHGATFRIYLPQVDDVVQEAEISASSTDSVLGSETILLVEDETHVRKLVAKILRGSGYTVLTAADPAAALELSDRHLGPIHLLLTDVVMPEMSGRELCQRLRNLRPQTKVLYMSGYTDEALGRHGVLEPGTFLLQKPFTSGALGRKVREVLDAPG
jgi:PAS domain S-box-containing protein